MKPIDVNALRRHKQSRVNRHLAHRVPDSMRRSVAATVKGRSVRGQVAVTGVDGRGFKLEAWFCATVVNTGPGARERVLIDAASLPQRRKTKFG